MSLDTEPAYQDIIEKLQTISNVTILETEDDNQVKRIGSEVAPYIIVLLGGPVRSGTDRGIVGSARDTNQMWVTLHCVSSNASVSRKLKNTVIGLLVDFEPEDSGRMTLDGGFQYSVASTSTLPTRYVETALMGFRHNMKV